MFSSRFRVYYEDTDLGGIVYHANYLKFCERARTDFTRDVLHFSQRDFLAKENKCFVATKLSCKFKAPARFEDELTVTCVPLHIRAASFEMYQEVFNQHNELLFVLRCSLAMIDFSSHRPLAIDPEFKKLLKEQEAPQDMPLLC